MLIANKFKLKTKSAFPRRSIGDLRVTSKDNGE